MRKIIGILFFCMFFAVSAAFAQTDLCFKNEGLKQIHTVSFTVTGSKLKGTFQVSEYDEPASAETFEFTGTKTGNLLTIKFRRSVPYELPPGTKKIVWTFRKTSLKIPVYGKDYQTNKFSTYTAFYEQCSEI
ncbi:MAG TPA: hypothetical protein VGC97_06925 [Pyrinomonadaceae bacterium]